MSGSSWLNDWLEQQGLDQLQPWQARIADAAHARYADAEMLVAEKQATVIMVSDELLMDEGVIPDTRPRVPVSWRTRLRWRLSDRRERLACWAYKLIAGHEVPEPDPDY